MCGNNGCNKKHKILLHNGNYSNDSSWNPTENVVSCHNQHQQKGKTLFRIVPVKLHGPNTILEIFASLDEGSSLTLIEEELANDLNLTGTSTSLCLKWTGDMVRTEEESRRVSLEISSIHKRVLHIRRPHSSKVKSTKTVAN